MDSRIEGNSTMKDAKKTSMYTFSKRTMDILGGGIGTIVGLPIMAVIALCILADDPKSSPFFIQKRIGKDGKEFKIYKFRTMITNAEEILYKDKRLYDEFKLNGYKFPEGKDPRVTKIGNILRKTSLDEIPQFINVLLGSMSLVGPRPIVKKELEEYGKLKNKFLSVKPGVTGLWQVSGRSEIQYPERCYIELEYIDIKSLKIDLKIIIKTIFSVFSKKGAF